MAKASRQRHRTKEQNRAKERARRQHDARQAPGTGHRPPPADRPSAADRLSALAHQLAADAINARLREDTDTFERCAAQLADRPGTPGWQRITDQYLQAALLHEVTTAWRQGWQPAELVRQVSRTADEWHAVMATELIGAELHRYAAATIDERWNVQLTELGVTMRSLDAGYLEHWADRWGTGRAATVSCALEVLYILAALPDLGPASPAARRGPHRRPGPRPCSSRPGRPADARTRTSAPG